MLRWMKVLVLVGGVWLAADLLGGNEAKADHWYFGPSYGYAYAYSPGGFAYYAYGPSYVASYAYRFPTYPRFYASYPRYYTHYQYPPYVHQHVYFGGGYPRRSHLCIHW